MTWSHRSRAWLPHRSPIVLRLSAIAMISTGLVGCGRRDPAGLYEISGSVTFAGRPVAGGRIVFEPDEARGASGMVSIGDIANGSYRTRPRRGFGGGPCRVTIYGTDGTMPTEEKDTALFAPWQTTIDLPREACRSDFDVPADAAAARSEPKPR